jgi:hypothetical protein
MLQITDVGSLHHNVLVVLHEVQQSVTGLDEILGAVMEQVEEAIVLRKERKAHQPSP